jgi:uncharacterized protein YggU (UPF0235/DUF167 family)
VADAVPAGRGLTPAQPPWRAVAGGVQLRVKAQPRARRPGLQGLVQGADGSRLKLAVNAAPEGGQANRAICALLAEALHVPPSRIAVVQGATSRDKTCHIAGDAAALAVLLARLTD